MRTNNFYSEKVIKKIQNRLISLRKENGFNQTEIADKLGTRQNIYGRYEIGENELPVRHLIALCKLYGVSADYILGLSDSHKPKEKPELVITDINSLQLKKIDHKKIMFISVSETSAQGEPGGVYIMTSDGMAYHCNYMFGNVSIDDLYKSVPVLAKCNLGIFGNGLKVPKGWKSRDIGPGNHLIVNDMVYEAYVDCIQFRYDKAEEYQIWKYAAWSVIIEMKDNSTM